MNDHSTAQQQDQTDTEGASESSYRQRWSLLAAALAAGLAAGFFFTYQISIVRGLMEVDDVTYAKAFQAFNATIRNPWFAAVFFGSLLLLANAVAATRGSMRSVRTLAGAALVLYVVVIGITFIGNVPLNNDLATFTSLSAPIATEARDQFESTWNMLNLVRAWGSFAAFVSIALASALADSTAVLVDRRRF